MLLLHGVGGSRRFWDHLGWEGAIDLPAGADPADLAAALTLDQLTVVVGHSLGGMVAQELALTPQSKVSAMILCCTIPGATHRVKKLNEESASFVIANGSRAWAQLMQDHLFAPSAPDDLRRWYVQETAAVAPEVIAAQLQAIGSWDARERLPLCNVPTLVIAGGLEPNLDDQRELASLLGADLMIIPNAAHMAPIEQPAEFLAAIAPFLATCPS
jgi:pimeloyl-ACP methyl ester carboxylesterase